MSGRSWVPSLISPPPPWFMLVRLGCTSARSWVEERVFIQWLWLWKWHQVRIFGISTNLENWWIWNVSFFRCILEKVLIPHFYCVLKACFYISKLNTGKWLLIFITQTCSISLQPAQGLLQLHVHQRLVRHCLYKWNPPAAKVFTLTLKQSVHLLTDYLITKCACMHVHADVTPVLQFDISELKECTRGFSPDHVIGEGGFGRVYWGLIRGTKAAIKVLTKVSYVQACNCS